MTTTENCENSTHPYDLGIYLFEMTTTENNRCVVFEPVSWYLPTWNDNQRKPPIDNILEAFGYWPAWNTTTENRNWINLIFFIGIDLLEMTTTEN